MNRTVAKAIEAAGGLTALAKVISEAGMKTTRHSVKRWLQDGVPKDAHHQIARTVVEGLSKRRAPAKGKERKAPSELAELLALLGTWRAVAAALGISEKRLRSYRDKGKEPTNAGAVLKQYQARKLQAAQKVSKETAANIRQLKALVKMAGSNAQAARMLEVNEATIRRWLKKGPPVTALQDLKRLREAPAAPAAAAPRAGKVDRAREVQAAAKAIEQLAAEQEALEKGALGRVKALMDIPGVKGLAAHLQVTPATVRGWVRRGKVPTYYARQLAELEVLYGTGVTTEDLKALRKKLWADKEARKRGLIIEHIGDMERVLDTEKTRGFQWTRHYGTKLTPEVIEQVGAFITRCGRDVKRMGKHWGRWQLVAIVDALKHKPDGEPVGNRVNVMSSSTAPGASGKKAGSNAPRVVMSLQIGKAVAGKRMPGESAAEHERRIDEAAQRFLPAGRIGLVRTSLQAALQDFLVVLSSTLDEGAIYLEGLIVKNYDLLKPEAL